MPVCIRACRHVHVHIYIYVCALVWRLWRPPRRPAREPVVNHVSDGAHVISRRVNARNTIDLSQSDGRPTVTRITIHIMGPTCYMYCALAGQSERQLAICHDKYWIRQDNEPFITKSYTIVYDVL